MNEKEYYLRIKVTDKDVEKAKTQIAVLSEDDGDTALIAAILDELKVKGEAPYDFDEVVCEKDKAEMAKVGLLTSYAATEALKRFKKS